MSKDKEIQEREAGLAALVDRSESSWRQGQIEVFDWCLVQVRKAFAITESPAAREALTAVGKKIREERDGRFPKHAEKAAANDETPQE